MRLSRRTISPVPLYFKVMTEIRDNILSGSWSRGFQVPGELDLARRLGRERHQRSAKLWDNWLRRGLSGASAPKGLSSLGMDPSTNCLGPRGSSLERSYSESSNSLEMKKSFE